MNFTPSNYIPNPQEISEYIQDFKIRNKISDEKMKKMTEYEQKMNDMNHQVNNNFPGQSMPLNSPGSGQFGGFDQWSSPQNPYLSGGSHNQSPIQNNAFQFYNKPQRSNTTGNINCGNQNFGNIPQNSNVTKSQFDSYNIALHQAKEIKHSSESKFMANQGFGNFGNVPGHLPQPGTFGFNQRIFF